MQQKSHVLKWLIFVALAALLAMSKPRSVLRLPTTEQVGKAVGKQSVPFTKGFVDGVKEQIAKRGK